MLIKFTVTPQELYVSIWLTHIPSRFLFCWYAPFPLSIYFAHSNNRLVKQPAFIQKGCILVTISLTIIKWKQVFLIMNIFLYVKANNSNIGLIYAFLDFRILELYLRRTLIILLIKRKIFFYLRYLSLLVAQFSSVQKSEWTKSAKN